MKDRQQGVRHSPGFSRLVADRSILISRHEHAENDLGDGLIDRSLESFLTRSTKLKSCY